MIELNPNKTFNVDNHPFILGIKGNSYRTFAALSGRNGYERGGYHKIDRLFIIISIGTGFFLIQMNCQILYQLQ